MLKDLLKGLNFLSTGGLMTSTDSGPTDCRVCRFQSREGVGPPRSSEGDWHYTSVTTGEFSEIHRSRA